MEILSAVAWSRPYRRSSAPREGLHRLSRTLPGCGGKLPVCCSAACVRLYWGLDVYLLAGESARAEGSSNLYGLPTMSVHSLMLADYNTKRVQNCATVTQVTNTVSRYNDLKTQGIPDTALSKMPRIPALIFPLDELPRPAVIGLGGSNGSYKDSTTAIKEILASVLNLPSSFKSALSMDVQDSDLENWEDSSNDDSDSDPDCVPETPWSQNDIRFTRHKAAWDNSQLDSHIATTKEPITSSPMHPIKGSQTGITELGFSSLLKCDKCAEMILTGSNTTLLEEPLNLQNANRRFSSPNLSKLAFNLNFNPNPHNPLTERCTFPQSPGTADSETSTVEDTSTCPRRSRSYSNILNAEGDSTSAESLLCAGENLFEPAINLEKENEHFLAADLFISMVERIRSNWQYEQWRTEGGMCWMKQEEPCLLRKKANSESAASVDSGYGGLHVLQNSPAETILEEVDESKNSVACEDYDEDDEYVIIELEDYEKLCKAKQSNDIPKRQTEWGLNSAEQIARNLYRNFRKQWTQVDEGWPPTQLATDMLAGTNTTAEEMESGVNLVEEIKKFKMREKEEWSPPIFQVISIIHPYVKRDVIVASQNYFCAGCGTKVEQRYTNRLRYCDYLGKYFCDCCHGYAESSIPGHILSKWNFSKYYVSNFAKSVIDKIWDSHQFDVQTENPELYKKVKDLTRVREVQEQLVHIKKLVATCRFSEGTMKAFEEVPSHLTEELHLFTLGDLFNVKQRTLLLTLRELLATAIAHVDTCVLCQANGFICEFCQNSDVIFPFQTDSCRRCEVCKSCYHKQCFKTGECPKCARIKAREALHNDSPFTSSGEIDSNSTQ